MKYLVASSLERLFACGNRKMHRLRHSPSLRTAFPARPCGAIFRQQPTAFREPIPIFNLAALSKARELATTAAVRERDPPFPPPRSIPDPEWVMTMNTALKNHPIETGASFMVLDMACVLGTYAAITQHMEIPFTFVLAFAMNRVLRKPRLPLDIAMAGAVARFFPSLTRVRVTAGLPQLPSAAVDGNGQERKNPLTKAALKAGQALRTGIDRYGLCLLVSQRMVMNLLTIGLSYAALRAGLDLDGMLSPLMDQLQQQQGQQQQGQLAAAASDAVAAGLLSEPEKGSKFAESVAAAAKTIAGPMAAAVAISSFFYPLVIYGSAVGGLKLGKLRAGTAKKASDTDSRS